MLTGGGGLITVKAWRRNWRYLPVGLMPLFAGIQQFMEGNVWLGVNSGDHFTMHWGAMGFIFFTWFMWPVWLPFCVYILEPNGSTRKRFFLLLTLAGSVFGVLLYIPHLLNADYVVVTVNNKSLAYENSMLLDYILPRWLTYAVYLFLIIAPPALSRYRHVRHFALTIVAVVIIDYLFLRYAYISFFCLLAGLATLHLVYIILTNKCAKECPELFA